MQPVSETGCIAVQGFITLSLSIDKEFLHVRISAAFFMGSRYRSLAG